MYLCIDRDDAPFFVSAAKICVKQISKLDQQIQSEECYIYILVYIYRVWVVLLVEQTRKYARKHTQMLILGRSFNVQWMREAFIATPQHYARCVIKKCAIQHRLIEVVG